MRNPWLDIPLADYEAHMALPYVGQARLLSDIFGGALDEYAPRSVAVLGCAGGNGFERIPRTVERAVGVDINPNYIERALSRFSGRIPALELFAGDVQTDEFAFAPVELVFAGLLFEYVDAAKVLAKIRSMICNKGTLVVVLQLPGAVAEITPSPCAALGALAPLMRLVPPEKLRELAEWLGYRQADARIAEAPGGKRFHVQAFRLETPSRPLAKKGE